MHASVRRKYATSAIQGLSDWLGLGFIRVLLGQWHICVYSLYNVLTNRIRKVLWDRSDPFLYVAIHYVVVKLLIVNDLTHIWSDDSPNMSITREGIPVTMVMATVPL